MFLLKCANYQKKIYKRFFTGTFYGSSGKGSPRTIYWWFYLELLMVSAERWAEAPFKELLGSFFFFADSVVCNNDFGVSTDGNSC